MCHIHVHNYCRNSFEIHKIFKTNIARLHYHNTSYKHASERKKAKRSSEALKLAREKKPSSRVYQGFLEDSEWRSLTIDDKRIRKCNTDGEKVAVMKQRPKKSTHISKNLSKRKSTSKASPSKALLRTKAVGAAE